MPRSQLGGASASWRAVQSVARDQLRRQPYVAIAIAAASVTCSAAVCRAAYPRPADARRARDAQSPSPIWRPAPPVPTAGLIPASRPQPLQPAKGAPRGSANSPATCRRRKHRSRVGPAAVLSSRGNNEMVPSLALFGAGLLVGAGLACCWRRPRPRAARGDPRARRARDRVVAAADESSTTPSDLADRMPAAMPAARVRQERVR